MDIANREVYTSSVKDYIEAQHRFCLAGGDECDIISKITYKHNIKYKG